MKIIHLNDCSEFVAGDNSVLREIFNPNKEKLALSYSLAHAKVGQGEKTAPHKLISCEVYYILKGKGLMDIEGEKKSVGENDTVYIPPDALQYIENIGEEPLEFLCMVEPGWKTEDEVIFD
jgi:mannose-6-phosphate isomerase-like protein (cupin superfamily)